jgi:hypothetical protein
LPVRHRHPSPSLQSYSTVNGWAPQQKAASHQQSFTVLQLKFQ